MKALEDANTGDSACNRAASMNAGFVLSGCPIVPKITIPIGGASWIDKIASLWDLTARSREQKLLPHFGKTGIAAFAIKEIE